MSRKKTMSEPIIQSIGNVRNYYGGLGVKSEDGKRYWSIENYDGDFWEEIPESLYLELVKYEEERKK